VRRVKGGEVDLSLSVEHDVTSEDLFRWALENDEGRFSLREVYKAFKKRGITYQQVQAIAQEFEEQEESHEPRIEIDDEFYHLKPGAGPNPRQLVKCEMCNENPDLQGDPDEGVDVVESDEEFSEDLETGENPEKSDWSLSEWDSDKEERDSARDVWDSDGDASEPDESDIDDEPEIDDGELPSDTPDLAWVAAEPVKAVKGDLANLQRDVVDWVAAAVLWDGAFRDAVKDWKYHGNETHVDLFKKILLEFFQGAWPFDRLPDALIPVPLHPKRLAARGFNQAAILAEALSDGMGIPIVEALKRVRDTQPQATQRIEYRCSNVERAFETTGVEVPGIVLVVDDLITTGATISECARVLKAAGALWVGGLALARPPLKASKKVLALARTMPPIPPNPLPTNGEDQPSNISDDDFSEWLDEIVDKSMKRSRR
jgi:ComF family protein